MKRRDFLSHTVGAAVLPAAATSLLAQAEPARNSPAADPSRPAPRPPLEVAQVKEFVVAAHNNLPKVKVLLGEHPRLVVASYDWGGGDFETGVGGAAHTGQKEIALHLLDAGARIDAFCAAMLGEVDTVLSLIRTSPAAAAVRGPHGYSLLHHAGFSGSVRMAEGIVSHLPTRARDCNQALLTATQSGHAELVAWLLGNGVDDVNTRNFARRTALDLAIKAGRTDLADLLIAAGGKPST